MRPLLADSFYIQEKIALPVDYRNAEASATNKPSSSSPTAGPTR
jgi:hypothetical protein